MTETVLVLGNKRYSSWSLRGYLALKFAGIAFKEEVILLPEQIPVASLQYSDFDANVASILSRVEPQSDNNTANTDASNRGLGSYFTLQIEKFDSPRLSNNDTFDFHPTRSDL